MGGRKQAQRTKNNVKPSSSHRSVQFLIDKNEHLKPILTFNYFTDFDKIETRDLQEYSDVDQDFLLTFKKMKKSDISTKLNGLKSFMELMEIKEKSTITRNILQQWALFYCEFSMDFDCRIREMAQIVHKTVMLQVKKDFAPCLKQVIGTWFLAQHDTSPVIRNAATSAFQVVFNGNKSIEAINVYQKQILNFIYEKLYEKPNSNHSSKQLKPDEIDVIKQKTVTTCLNSYAKYLSLLDEKTIGDNPKNNDFISHSEFWKFSNHKNLIIKAGWFSVAEVLCDKHTHLLNQTQQTAFIKSVINNFDVCDSMIIQHIWKCFLIMTTKYPNWIHLIDLKKSFLPKIWKILRNITTLPTNGVLTVYENVLNVIQKLPNEVFKDFDFIQNYFTNFNVGLRNNVVFKINYEYPKSAYASYRKSIEFFFDLLPIENQLELFKDFTLPILELSLNSHQNNTDIFHGEMKSLLIVWQENGEQNRLVTVFEEALLNFIHLTFEEKQDQQFQSLIKFLSMIKGCGNCNTIFEDFSVKLYNFIVKQPSAKYVELFADFLNANAATSSNLKNLALNDCKSFLKMILEWNSLDGINRKKLVIMIVQLLQHSDEFTAKFFKMFSVMLSKNLSHLKILDLSLILADELFRIESSQFEWIHESFLYRLLHNDVIDDDKIRFFENLVNRSSYTLSKNHLSKMIDKINEEIQTGENIDKYEQLMWILLQPLLRSSDYQDDNIKNLIVHLYVYNFDQCHEVDVSNKSLQQIENKRSEYEKFLQNSLDIVMMYSNSQNTILSYSNDLKQTFEQVIYLSIMSEYLLKQKRSKMPDFDNIRLLNSFQISYREKCVLDEKLFLHNLERILFVTMYYADLIELQTDHFDDQLIKDTHLIVNLLTLFVKNYRDNYFYSHLNAHLNHLRTKLQQIRPSYSDYLDDLIHMKTTNSLNDVSRHFEDRIRHISIQNVIEECLRSIDFKNADNMVFSITFLNRLWNDHVNLCKDILLPYWIQWYNSAKSQSRIDLSVFYEECAHFGLDCIELSREKSPDLLQLALKLLKLNKNVFQVLGRLILEKSIPYFVEEDQKILDIDENMSSKFLNYFIPVLDWFQIKIENMFLNLELSKDFVQLWPYKEFSDHYKFENIWGYLLLMDSILDILRLASNCLRLKYIEQLKKIDFISRFLYNVFYLMPEEVLSLESYRIRKEKIEVLFSKKPDIDISDSYRIELSENFACWLYCQSLLSCGAFAREWWTDCNNQKVKNLIEKITTICCSSIVFQQEMNSIIGKENDLSNLDIKVSKTTREITSTYTFEDLKMDLIIKIPHNYPLGNCQVELSQKIDDDKKVKNSIKQLLVFLRYRNGNIYEAIQMWKMNLDKKLSGIDECYICYSVAHVSNYELPKMCCVNCQKKFHSACLYKWFSTSNNSTCPICRSQF